MSFLKLINEIDADKFEEEARDDFMDRKKMLGKMGNWSKKLALSAVPLGAFAAFAEPARAQSTLMPTEALNFALTLEYLEATFYTEAKETGVYDNPPAPAKANVAGDHEGPTFNDIEEHERQHVAFLQEALGDAAISRDSLTFDFTLGGQLQPFENFGQFLLLAQAFEDTGVRAYKGQAGALIENDTFLTAALRIHSVEARHASAVRRIRNIYVDTDIQGWIPFDQPGADDLIAAVYEGESNTTHAGVNVAQVSNVGEESITEAWDEPLTSDEVLAIVNPFITSN